MNKIEKYRLFKMTKPAEGMRVVFKKRNNYKEKVEKLSLQFESPTSVSLSRLTPTNFDQTSLRDVKNHVRNHLKTEYHDKYRDHTTNFDHHPPSLSPSNRPILTQNSSRSPQIPSPEEIRASLNCSHLSPKTNDSPVAEIQTLKNKEPNSKNLSLNEIEGKIEESLHNRLKTCLQFNKSQDWKGDLKLAELIQIVKDLKNMPEEQQSEDPEIQNRKINLIEQLLAENTVEGQILKKYYFSKLSKKSSKVKNSLHTIGVIDRKIEESPIRKKEFFIRTTENRSSFQKPEQEAYKIYKQQNRFFNSGRRNQPLPRSSYSREFLDYNSGVHRFPISKPRDSSLMKGYDSAKSLKSTYQQSFTAKKVQKIDPKGLDACKNKIKNLPINFGRHEKQPMIDKLNRYIQGKREGKNQRRDEVPFLKSNLLTESRREYKGLKQELVSKIKHKNLEQLRYALKNKIHV